jgi:hypothetical protein
MNGQLMSAIFLVGAPDACSSFVNGLAWAGSTPAVVKPKTSAAAKGEEISRRNAEFARDHEAAPYPQRLHGMPRSLF